MGKTLAADFQSLDIPDMLATLRVKNLALVENVRLDFESGLNVITGETGAGKSILIGALHLLLGDRADKKYIRAGADACGAEALFKLARPQALNELLEALGVAPCEDGQLILRRIVKAAGGGQNLINDSPVTLQALKQVGELLVDMHGPYDHQSLLSPAFQLDVLDAYGQIEAEREAYAKVYREWTTLLTERADLQGDDQDVAGQIEMLTYRVKEIEELAPVEGEDEQVAREHMTVSHAQRILELGDGARKALLEGEGSAFDQLAAAQRNLEELARLLPEAEEWRLETRTLAVQLQSLSEAMISALDRVEADPARLQWLEQRLAAYQKLKRKYGSVADVLAVLAENRERLRKLQTRGERLAELEGRIAAAHGVVLKKGRALSAKRRAAGEKMALAVVAELRELGFPRGGFAVDLQEGEPQSSGLDTVSFGFAPNVGEPMRPLRDIASSGEISRVMLATKAVLAGHDHIPVLVFDEVDANIGGEMGNAVGRKLAQLGKTHQVICITHLPQVAVHGDQHYAVTKRVREDRTFTEVDLLDGEPRVEEIARMLGGKDMTKLTLQHARAMLKS
jgi:DNA repair protein RecN (Recombination protein N)